MTKPILLRFSFRGVLYTAIIDKKCILSRQGKFPNIESWMRTILGSNVPEYGYMELCEFKDTNGAWLPTSLFDDEHAKKRKHYSRAPFNSPALKPMLPTVDPEMLAVAEILVNMSNSNGNGVLS